MGYYSFAHGMDHNGPPWLLIITALNALKHTNTGNNKQQQAAAAQTQSPMALPWPGGPSGFPLPV